MARPVVSDAAERLYAALGATTVGDDTNWLLLQLCEAVTQPLAVVDTLAADTVDGVGWSSVLDLTRAPAYALGWLAQFVGVRTLPGLDDAAQRLRIAGTEGWRRGTPAAIEAAAKQWLTGTQLVTLTERSSSAYTIEITVYTAQATDPDQLQRAIEAAIPAGIIATVNIIAGWTVAEFEADYSGQTVADVESDFTGMDIDDFERTLP